MGLRRRLGVQVAAVGLGFVVPIMFVLGPIFALLWGTAYGLGRKIERERAEAYAAHDVREQGEGPPQTGSATG